MSECQNLGIQQGGDPLLIGSGDEITGLQGWIKEREKSSESKGRPQKVYELAVPMTKIMGYIEEEKKKEAKNQLTLVGKLREYIC